MGGAADLVLKAACDACGKASELYSTACRHAILCNSCAATMARSRARCNVCAAHITNVIREYNVRVDTTAGKALSIAQFNTGVPPFSKMKGAGNKWSLRKDGLTQGRQLTADMREKYYNRKPWILEDDTGEHQYQTTVWQDVDHVVGMILRMIIQLVMWSSGDHVDITGDAVID
ncbi:transcription initiation factor IIF subunit alpha-like [Triticum dicoccoides]|uniref:transcription initiation factor IIF subunit alpha-like n=1 Tax=Triticum dicoccoides TaxID=85692 RepID=UPI0018914F2F|nr:transcription initiation factor IIF subunit alpha-like [Triticum dicoccoides]